MPCTPPSWLRRPSSPCPRVFILLGAASRGAAEHPHAPRPPCACTSPSGPLDAPGSGCHPHPEEPPRLLLTPRPAGPRAPLPPWGLCLTRVGVDSGSVLSRSLVLSPCAWRPLDCIRFPWNVRITQQDFQSLRVFLTTYSKSDHLVRVCSVHFRTQFSCETLRSCGFALKNGA